MANSILPTFRLGNVGRNTLQRNVGAGIHIGAVVGNAEVQVVAGGNAGPAHGADQLTGGNRLAGADHRACQVHIDGGEAVSMIDGDVVACRAGIGIGGDNAGAGGIDRRIGGSRQVNTLVVLLLFLEIMKFMILPQFNILQEILMQHGKQLTSISMRFTILF